MRVLGEGEGERRDLVLEEAGAALVSRDEVGFDERLRLRGLIGLASVEESVVMVAADGEACRGSLDELGGSGTELTAWTSAIAENVVIGGKGKVQRSLLAQRL